MKMTAPLDRIMDLLNDGGEIVRLDSSNDHVVVEVSTGALVELITMEPGEALSLAAML